jgi:RNA polymerase sigma factor FliA
MDRRASPARATAAVDAAGSGQAPPTEVPTRHPARVDDALNELWQAYKSTGDMEIRNRLVLQYAPLVKYVAGRVWSGLPDSVDRADLTSEGVIGLMDAIDKFQPERGMPFQAYAVPRIRGAIIDWLRSSDWVPRTVRTNIREIERAQVALRTLLGRNATDAELSYKLDISTSELNRLYSLISYTKVASVDELGIADFFDNPQDSTPDAGNREILMAAVAGLGERDQAIVAMYYFEHLTMAEIGQVLRVSESRVSQLHSRATLSLRAGLTLALER